MLIAQLLFFVDTTKKILSCTRARSQAAGDKTLNNRDCLGSKCLMDVLLGLFEC
jgi:hypothetical protein